ncbi:hypothetical protein [Sphingopyxis kveilinensis]|uniref:hypothetical protein n=1 Tax=Sphingopyxis kveilinensis TaxID=3114367 RepID=UPI0030CE988F
MLYSSSNTLEFAPPASAVDALDAKAHAVEAVATGFDLKQPITRLCDRRRVAIPLFFASLVSGTSVAAAPPSADLPFVNSSNVDRFASSIDLHRLEIVGTSSSNDMSGVLNWIAAWASGASSDANASAYFTEIIDSLETLEDGWNGVSSVAPSEYVKSDLRILAAYMRYSRQPEVEVDNDGSIALRWEDDERTLALTLNGNGRLIGTMYPRTENFPLEFGVGDSSKIAELFSISEVRSTLL